MSGPILYGIKNCDTVRRARRWLDAHGIDYRFHDLRADGVTPEQVAAWADELGWEALLNRRGMTWRRLPAKRKEAIDRAAALALMVELPAIIKRPILDLGERRELGFSEARYTELFSAEAT